MQINTHSHMLPLGWLPLTAAAKEDGFLPVHRRLHTDGREIIDEWGQLNPCLFWRQGRGRGESLLEGAYALELIRSSAEESSLNENARHISREWSPERMAGQIPSFGDVAQAWSAGNKPIALTSPRIPTGGTRGEWLAALPQLLPFPQKLRLGMLMRDPARLLRVGYQMLCQEWTYHGQGRLQTGEALAIIGLGALGLFPRVRCAVCYRLAMPATNRCARHSQTQSIRVDTDGPKVHAQISSEARLAKQVIAQLGWAPDELLNDFGHDGFVEEKTIGGLLWGRHVGDARHTLQHVRDGLDAGHLSRVRALLPANFCELDDTRACASLRRHIDPGEWVLSYWSTRVWAAEAWLRAAEALSPGRAHMKPTDQNRERVAKARALLQQGMSKKNIAVQLGISQSHLSHLLRRH